MGYIILYSVNFTPSAAEPQTVRVEYRVASNTSGAFFLENGAAPVLANGNFSPILTLGSQSAIADGETYTVKITNLCNGSVQTRDIQAGQGCLQYVLQANTGGATVEWEDCQSGIIKSQFINGGQQNGQPICSRSPYSVTFGAVTEVTTPVDCQ